MASAEKLLNEAQYAFNGISAGEARDNSRNRSRAISLCKKIVRKYPTSTEASEAHSILRRLGEEAFLPQMPLVHRHGSHDKAHRTPEPKAQRSPTGTASGQDDAVPLDWSGLMSVILATPKVVLGVIGFVAFILFGIFGPFIFLALLALLFFATPVRAMLQPRQRKEINALVIRANAWIDDKYRSGSGLT
jgi:hypothetical protein